MRVILALIFLFTGLFPASAQRSGATAPDPDFVRPRFDNFCCGYELNGKAVASQTINTGIRNLILVVAGQSNVCNNNGTTYSPSNGSKIDNLNIFNGRVYSATDPLLGTTSDSASLGPGNFTLRLADNLITANKFDRVIILIIAIGGTTVADWDTGSASGRFVVAFNRMLAKGITIGLTNTTTVILWGQGENDNTAGTGQAAYAASLANVIAQSRAAGFIQGSVPWFVAEETWAGGAVSANVQNAQLGIVNHGANIWAGPNTDSLNALNRQADNTHLNATGAAANATLWQTALGGFGPPF